MSETIIVSLISLVGTFGGSVIGILTANKLVNYRIDQLEKKVDKHNQVVERTFKLETDIRVLEERVDEVEGKLGEG